MQSFTVVALLGCSLAFSQAKPNIGFGSIENPKYTPRVINGEDSVLGQFPYQASLQMKGLPPGQGHFCGGSVIAEYIIMTAANCVVGGNVTADVEVHVGFTNLADEGPNVQTSTISLAIIPPDFEGGPSPNDIAILLLDKPLKMNEYVQPIRYPVPGDIPEGEAVLTGWGSTSTTSTPDYPPQLQFANVELISYEECEQIWGVGETPLAESNLCTGVADGPAGACTGDSGGPLVQNGTLIGIVSWGHIPCGGYPTVYTRLSAFDGFVEEQLAYARTLHTDN